MLRALVDLAFPGGCPACGRAREQWLCRSCLTRCTAVRDPCTRCGRPRSLRRCADCSRARFAFAAARAPFVYEGPARDALLRFKLGGERRAAAAMARAMLEVADALEAERVAWVPSTRRTRARRGFDPAEELARSVARLTGLPGSPMLRKLRETRDQAGLDRAARVANLTAAFASASCAGSVLLVDDVLTTGATADACARALLESGADKVTVLTFARAV